MKKLFTLLTIALLGLVTANAQSQIPGSLDLSTAVVEAGAGDLHEGAGWDGSKIDWMTKGNTATIEFENTKDGAKYKIISYGGTNQEQVVVGFSILDANGNVVYDETTEPYAQGGFGDKKKNNSLPETDALAAGKYTLVLFYDNLKEGETLEVNITQIDFIDADEYVEDTPSAGLGLNIPCTLDGSKAVITKNCSWGSTPSVDDSNNFNWVGNGDVITFAITNTKEAAYNIIFDTATPCEPVTIDFLITDMEGNTVYGQTANVVRTGDSGSDWDFKPEGHNTSLPATDVLPVGNYTLTLTFHQGINYPDFTTNLKDITFVVSSDEIELDLTKTEVEAGTGDLNSGAGWNGTNIDWMQNGNIAKVPFTITTAGEYQIIIGAGTICDEANVTAQIIDADGNELYSEKCVFENNNSFGDFVDNSTLPVTPALAVGSYTLVLTYGQAMYAGAPTNVTVNIGNIRLSPAGGSSTDAPNVFLHGANFDKANSTNDLYQFTDAEDFTLTMNGRDVNKTPSNWTYNEVAYTDGINFKNNDPGTINVPAGKKIYAIAIGGTAQSDNGDMNYLYKVDVDGQNFFTDAIGTGVKENSTIQSSATYPMYADATAPQFALIDLTAAPATEGVTVQFSGNVQVDVWFKLYITEADANKVLGKGDGGETAEKTLYTWIGAEAGATEKGGKAVAEDGESINLSNNSNYVIRLNGSKSNVDTEKYVEITLDEALEAGDQINITAYRYKDNDAVGTIYFKFENGTVVDDEYLFPNIHPDYAGTPAAHTWTVAEAAGSKSFRMTRGKTGTNVLITKIEIIRGAATGIQTVETVTVKPANNFIYNLAGQRVDENYKGVVIKNGRKYVQK